MSNVNHPNHYQSESGLEVIDVIEAFTKDLTGPEAFCVGNAIKYICRFNKKNGVEDLEKAQWYIKRVIEYRSMKPDKKADKANAMSCAEYAEADVNNTMEMFKHIPADAFSSKISNETNTSDTEIITNIAELNHYTAMVKDFGDQHLLISFGTRVEGGAFISKIKSGIYKNGQFSVRDLSMLCLSFSETAAFDVTKHYCSVCPDTVLWRNKNEVVIDDIYTHEDGAVTLAIKYPIIHTNKED